MAINPITSSTATYETTQTASSELQDSFLTMLMAQLQYQDPLNPMENTEFTSQLAQINTVEQLQGVNQNIGYLQLYLASINNSQAIGFIGKEVIATGDSIYWDGETPASINYHLHSTAANVVVNVYDANNHLVDIIRAGNQEKGMHEVPWYGTYLNGETAPESTYKFKVIATDGEGNSVKTTTMLSGPVEGIYFEEGITYVLVNGQRIPIGDIVEIKTPQQIDTAAEDEEDSAAEDDETEDGGTGEVIEDAVDTAIKMGALAVKAAPLLL